MNVIVIKGRLTRDPETRQTDSGKSVTNFGVAVNRRFQKDKADFFNVTAWEKTGEFVGKYFSKGQEIVVQGEMQSRDYTDKSGNKRIAWDLIASNVEFSGSKQDGQNSGGSYKSASAPPNVNLGEQAKPSAAQYASGPSNNFQEIPADDDLPF